MKIFGSSAGADEIAEFGSLAESLPTFTTDPALIQSLSAYLGGWFSAVLGTNSPAIEDMNALCYLYAYQLAYIMQAGTPEWEVGTTYYTGSFAQSAGVIYMSRTDTNIGNLVSDTTNWKSVGGGIMTAIGDVLYGAANGAATRLAGNTVAVTKVLTQAGTGSASQAPTWLALTDSLQLQNAGVGAAVAANALTVSLKQADGTTNPGAAPAEVETAFRNATATTGGYNVRPTSGALSVVVSSGSTLGHISAVNQYIYVYLIDNAGTPELAVSSSIFDEGSVVSTTAEGGAGAADSYTTMYSTTARSNVPCRLIARLKSNQATAGTWATAISEISPPSFLFLKPVNSVLVYGGVGSTAALNYGSSSTAIRQIVTTKYAYGSAITYANSASLGTTFTINEDGLYDISYADSNAVAPIFGISVNSNQLTTSIDSISEATFVTEQKSLTSGALTPISVTVFLRAGDILRPHGDPGLQSNQFGDKQVRFLITKVS